MFYASGTWRMEPRRVKYRRREANRKKLFATAKHQSKRRRIRK